MGQAISASSSAAVDPAVLTRRLLGVIRADAGALDLVQEGSRVGVEPAVASQGGALGSGGAAIGPRDLLADRSGPIGGTTAHGEGVFDFRYGPFAGGFPEAGVFHLSTYGERILSCRIDIAYKHRGIEEAMVGSSIGEGLRWAEAVCGSFAFAHSLAYCRAVESALGIEVSPNDQRLRLIGLEMERIYNHLLVIARLAQAAAQKVLDAHLSALFEEALRLNGLFAGSRLLSGANRIGGIGAARADARPVGLEGLARGAEELRARFGRLYETSLANRNYLDRLHLIGVVGPKAALASGLTGPSLRAAGDASDLRSSEQLLAGFAPIRQAEGDSLARMEVRAEEVLQSCDIVRSQLAGLLEGETTMSILEAPQGGMTPAGSDARGSRSAAARPRDTGSGIGAAESPSGTVAWWLDIERGRIRQAYASTPSLFGFRAFAEAITSHIFTDFPFALESFGLSFADAAR